MLDDELADLSIEKTRLAAVGTPVRVSKLAIVTIILLCEMDGVK